MMLMMINTLDFVVVVDVRVLRPHYHNSLADNLEIISQTNINMKMTHLEEKKTHTNIKEKPVTAMEIARNS